MRPAISSLVLIFSLLTLGGLLSSFVAVPTPPSTAPTATQQQSLKKEARLKARLAKAPNSRQQQRLQRRLQRFQQHRQQQQGKPISLSVLGLACGVAAMLFLAISTLMSFTVALGSGVGATLVGIGFVLTLILVIIGMTCSILGVIRSETPAQKRLGIAGIIINAIVLVPVFVSFFSFFGLI